MPADSGPWPGHRLGRGGTVPFSSRADSCRLPRLTELSCQLRELATETGLADAVIRALLDTCRGFPVHMPGQVFADLAVAIADGADAVTGIEVLRAVAADTA